MPNETRPLTRYCLKQPVSSTSTKKTIKSNCFPGSNFIRPAFWHVRKQNVTLKNHLVYCLLSRNKFSFTVIKMLWINNTMVQNNLFVRNKLNANSTEFCCVIKPFEHVHAQRGYIMRNTQTEWNGIEDLWPDVSKQSVSYLWTKFKKKMSRDVKRTVLARRILAVYFLALFVSTGVKTFELPV